MKKSSDEDLEARLIARYVVAMAKDSNFGKKYGIVYYLIDSLYSGNAEEARKGVISMLRSGRAPELVQLLAADLLEGSDQRRGRGRPRHIRPSRWMEVGSACEERRREVKPRVKNIPAVIAQEFGLSESEVKRADTFYRKVARYIDEELERVGGQKIGK